MARATGRQLTIAQERYAAELVTGKSQREAYRIAYPSSLNWKDATVDSKASTLFRHEKVRERYDEIRQRIADRIEAEALVSVKDVLCELKKVAFADIKDYLSYKTEKQIVGIDEETGLPVYEYKPVIELVDSDKVDGKVIQEVSVNSKGMFTFKMHSKMDALEKIGRHLKMYTDKVEQTIDSEIVVRMEGLEDLMK